MPESTDIRYPIFIVGMPRSGTTLLSCMLDAHSQLAVTPETNFYTHCRGDDGSPETTVDDLWNCLRQQPGVQDMDLTEQEVGRMWEHLEAVENPCPPDLLRALCSTYAERSGATAWGEKTPEHLAHVPTILEEFPEAIVLGIVRDPRDVCLSLQGMPWNSSSLPEAARKWRRFAQVMERYQSDYPDQVREVRYEDVLDAPGRVMRDVLAWIGVSFEERVLSFHEQEAGPADPDREPWKEKTRRPIDPTNKEKWRDRMSPGARFLVELIAGGEMKLKGYEASERGPGLREAGGLVWEIGRAVGTVARRRWRKWRMPKRRPGDHTPAWMRRRAVFSESENGGNGSGGGNSID